MKEEYFDLTEESIVKEDGVELFAFVYPHTYMLTNIGDTYIFHKVGDEFITIPTNKYLEINDKARTYNKLKKMLSRGEVLTLEDFDI